MKLEVFEQEIYVPGTDHPGQPNGASRDCRSATWRWRCGSCKVKSFCTFPTRDEAERYAGAHVCRST